MNQSFQKHYGSDNFILTYDAMKHQTLNRWYQILIQLVDRLAGHQEFELTGSDYQHSPELFVTDGVEGYFKGEAFSIWSDQPGEIIVKYTGKHVERFIALINEQ